ncbi:protein kinase [Romboutsia hominis]|uniref:Protein kinase n=1 Tax=Romboutsia faecis TaxID=2764597 RepID=A0ABR7JLT6_9FIRM|nr:protein kinase [Romboutsia faecis]MBC5995795.1 protein kinase [Romboutsia faecis]
MVNFTNKYQSLELISNDKSKLIYVATNTETDKKVVLKLYKKTDYQESQFEELKKIVEFSGLNKNNNLIKIHDVDNGIYDDIIYYIVEMEYIKDKCLESLIENKNLNENESLKIIEQLIDGLNELHRLNIVYKNLSTDKIFVNEEGTLKLDPTGYIDKYNQNIKYISPEQASDKPINKTSDIYSIGIILYEIINKELPFVWENGKEELYKSMTKEFYIGKDKCSDNVVSILENCLYIDPAERYENLDVLLLDIRSCLDYNISVFRNNRENEYLVNKENIKISKNNDDEDFKLKNEIKLENELKIKKENEQSKETEQDYKDKKYKYIKLMSACAAVALVSGGLILKGPDIIDKLKNNNDSSNVDTLNKNSTIKDNDKSYIKENQEEQIDSIPENEPNTDKENYEYKNTKKQNTYTDIDNTTTLKPNHNTDDAVNTTPQKPQTKPEQTPNETPEETPDDTLEKTEDKPEETPDDTPEKKPEETPDDTPQNPEQKPEQVPDNITNNTPSQTPNNAE